MRVGEVIADDSAAWAAPVQRPISSWFPGPNATASNVAPALSAAFMEGPTRAAKEPVHVLLIEDDPAIAEMYRVQLEYDGFRVTQATTGEIGYKSLVASRPDIVLLDLLLPDRSG